MAGGSRGRGSVGVAGGAGGRGTVGLICGARSGGPVRLAVRSRGSGAVGLRARRSIGGIGSGSRVAERRHISSSVTTEAAGSHGF